MTHKFALVSLVVQYGQADTVTVDTTSIATSGTHNNSLCVGAPKTTAFGAGTFVGVKDEKSCADFANKPVEYAHISIASAGLIAKSDTGATQYLTDDTLWKAVTKTGALSLTEPAEKTVTGGKMKHYSFGTAVGDAELGGYISMAAYLGTDGKVDLAENDFKVENKTVTACAAANVSKANDTSCDHHTTVNKGYFKFSLFGRQDGTNYSADFDKYSFFAVRTILDISNMGTGASVKVNKQALSTVGTQSIQEMEIVGEKTKLYFAFPKFFNYGEMAGDVANKKGSEMVHIRANKHSTGVIHIDYLFKLMTNSTDGFFVYDPTVVDASDKVAVAAVQVAAAVPEHYTTDSAVRLGAFSVVFLAIMALN